MYFKTEFTSGSIISTAGKKLVNMGSENIICFLTAETGKVTLILLIM